MAVVRWFCGWRHKKDKTRAEEIRNRDVWPMQAGTEKVRLLKMMREKENNLHSKAGRAVGSSCFYIVPAPALASTTLFKENRSFVGWGRYEIFHTFCQNTLQSHLVYITVMTGLYLVSATMTGCGK